MLARQVIFSDLKFLVTINQVKADLIVSVFGQNKNLSLGPKGSLF